MRGYALNVSQLTYTDSVRDDVHELNESPQYNPGGTPIMEVTRM